jgi:hypothetical protein
VRDGDARRALGFKLVEHAIIAVPQGRPYDRGKAVAILADHVNAGLEPGRSGARQESRGCRAVLRIGLVETVEQQQVAQVENAGAALAEIEMGGVQERVSPALMKECAAPRGLDRHDVGVGGGRALAGMQLVRVDTVCAAIGADKLTGLVLADQTHGLQRERRLEPCQIDQQVVRAAAVTGGLLEDVGQRVLSRVNVGVLRPVDDPVSACQAV